uniref:Nuclear mitotic apparatus protein 1 n=1 Tax=Anolis carolinensis TaxID=28377 RepID=H9GTM5_ANOCA
MQTPQFQLRRLKNLLEAERENRDELEHELAENRKLIDEKDTRILMMKQRIDRLTLLHERQAADQMEPKEMEELREKNESLLMRLHETLKQCQDLKTEKGQMDRKINQLSEENGDLSFRLREFSRTLTELRGAMNEISEEHDKALREWEERRSRLETELHGALSEKRSLEEKVEILQGKYSLLEDQFTKLKDSMSLPEKGEVMSDVLKLADLNQQVSDLSGKQAELQARILGLEEEKHLLEVNLQSERRSFDSEKAQLTSLLTDLQKSASEISRAKDQLEQDRQAQEVRLVAQVRTLTEEIAKLTGCLHQKDGELLALHQQVEMERIQKGQLVEDLQKNEQVSQAALQELNLQVDHLNNTLKQSGEKLAQVEAASQEEYNKAAQEKELALRQLQQKEAELVTLGKRLQSLEQARSTSVAEAQREKAELNQKIQELEARALALTAQCQQSEAQAVALPALKSQLREAQQRLAEKEKLSKENTRILEDEKRRAGESLESNLRRIAELEEQIQELVKDRDQAAQKVDAEKAQRQALEGQVREMGEESRSKVQELQQQVAELSSVTKGQSGEEMVRGLVRDREQLQQKLKAEHEKVAEAEAQMKRLRTKHQDALAELQASLSLAHSQAKVREGAEEKLRSEVASLQEEIAASRQEDLTTAESSLSSLKSSLKEKEQEVGQFSTQVKSLKAKLEEATQQQKRDLALQEEERKRLAGEEERAKAELATEKAAKAALEVQLQNLTNEHRVEVSGLQEEVTRAQDLAAEKERELEELRLKNVSRSEELRDLQKTVSKLKGELASVEALKEREAKMERELQGFLEVARTRETEMESIKATLHSKDLSLKHLEEEKRLREQECSSSRELCEKQLKECEGLRAQVGKLERQNKEQQSTIAKLEKAAATLEQGQETATEALKQEVAQYKQRASELEKLLQAAKSVQEANLEKLRRELLGKGEELAQSREAASKAEKELASLRASAQEKGKSEESWKEQMSRCLQDAERKASLISSLEQEMSIMHRQLLEKEAESKDLRRLVLAESEKSKKLEERLRLLQSEMATAASRAAERCSAMKVEAQNYQEQAEKLHVSVEALKKELGALSKREEDLCKELKAWQEKAFQKEQLLSTRQQELVSAQALIGELMPVKRLYQQLQMEQASQESKHRQEAEQMQKAAGGLQAELAQTKRELAELLATKDRFLEQERAIQRLQAENSGYTEQLATLQRAHSQLAEENRALSERSSHGLQRLDTELAQAKQKYTQELEAAKLDSEKMMAATKREAEEAQKKLETMTNKYEEAKQKLLTQVERLEVYKKEQAKQVMHKREEELQAMVRQANEKAGELQAQLTQKEKATEHYKAQMEKAKTHYNAKKQENQELAKKLKGLEQLEKENMELKAESERLVKELQHTVMQAKESELSCKNLTGRVRSLEAQVEFADRQLREQGKFQVAKDTLKSRETFRQSAADISTDSLDLSASEETQPLNFTRYLPPQGLDNGGGTEEASQTQLPRKMESLESLYFTPIPTRSRSKLENSMASATEASFESGHKTLSGRRRTTQVISITMTKKRPEAEGPISPNESFFSIHSESSQASSQETLKTRLRSAATSSTRSLPSLASPESLNRLSSSSPNDTATSNAALMSLPGYRPTTRSSSLRHPQPTAGGTGTGDSSFYVGSCHDEPEPLDEWNRIAELQERNRVCPPHLKTCYPLESRPSQSLTTITDEEILTGDPKETLRRATLLPSQVAEVRSTRRSTLSTAGTEGGIATRQQRKRLSDEPQHGLGTPESKKSASCFPRPQTPKAKGWLSPALSPLQPERRQSLAFTLLNTPKKLGNSLLRRGANRKVTPKNSPRGGIRRSPRTSASPRGKVGRLS